MRKEPIVFLVVLAFAAYEARAYLGGADGRGRGARTQELDLEALALPRVDVALPVPGRATTFQRNLFDPPSPTSPLPPLAVEPPRLDELPALEPPTGFGPEPRYYGILLRETARPPEAVDLPDLFQGIDLERGDVDFDDEGGADDLEELEGEERLPDDPEERAARVAGLKRQYDWIYRNTLMFGRIKNENRYELALSDELPEGTTLEFVQVDPFTGRPLYGDNVIEFAAADIQEFGLVDTPLTRIEVGFASFPDPLPPTRFSDALRFAETCVELRNETPRALEVAEELYRRAQAINTQDSIEPRLGLARCYELGFRLDDAHAVYRELIDGGFAGRGLVHARLASLLATLRLDAEAKASFEEAAKLDPADWEVRQRYGRFLASRSRVVEALPHFEVAVAREPRATEARRKRVQARLDLATALMRLGRGDDAFEAFQKSLAADPDGEEGLADVCSAGLLTAARFSSGAEATAALAEGANATLTSGGVDAKLAAGLVALDAGRYQDAAQLLLEARGIDPFRAFEAERALSRLAELTGNVEEAETFANSALAGNPRDPWTLYQIGRLAERAGDIGRARSAYEAALALELEFGPALLRLAGILEESGDADAAERYYERATDLEPRNGQAWARRGWNALGRGDLDLAKRSFEEARRLSPGNPSPRAGLAWWLYASGDSAEALILLGEIVDDARSEGSLGPWSEFAETEAARILDHDSKEVFRDRFDRANGRIANNWIEDKGVGPLSDIRSGAVRISGSHQKSGRTRVFRQLPPDRFLAFSCELTVGPEARGTRAGVFISSESENSGGNVRAEIALARSRDGDIEVRVQSKSTDQDAAFRTVRGPEWPVGEPIRVTIERSGEDLLSRFTLYVDGEPVMADIAVDAMLSSRQNLRFGAFVEGEPGRVADLVFDDVRVVRRK